MWPLIATVLAVGILVVTLVVVSGHKYETARWLLWVGLVAPFSFGVQRGTQELQETGVDAIAALRFGIPFCCLLLALASTRALRKGWTTAEWWLGGFIAVCFASAFWSVGPKETVLKALVLLVQFAIVAALVRRYTDLQAAVHALVSFVHLILLTVVVGALVMPGAALGYTTDGGARLGGVFPPVHPNMLGLIAVVGMLALVCAIGPSWTLRIGPRLFLFALYTVELLGARTRAALIVGVIAIGIAMLRLHRRPGVLLWVIAAVTAGVVVVPLQTDALTDFLQRGQTITQVASLSGRTAIWDAAVTEWWREPFLGFGYYSGHRLALQPIYQGANQSNLDNVWVESLLDVGLVGTIPLAVFVVLALVRTVRRTAAVDHAGTVFATSALLLLLSATFFNPSLQTVGFAATLFGFLLLASGPNGGAPADTGDPPRPRRDEAPRARVSTWFRPGEVP